MQGAPFVDRMPTGQSMDPAFNPYGIAIGANGNFLYGYDSGDQDISIFPIDPATGALGAVQKTGNTAGGVCAGELLRVDPTGKYLYGLGAQQSQCVGGEAVIGFTINQTNGSLSVIPNGPFPANVVPFTDGLTLVP
jgi:6-phosphogluconolactonase (cycloisomerase 2 family)